MRLHHLITSLLFISGLYADYATEASQKNALIDLYNSTNGSNWTDHTNWLNGDPCHDGNEWYGIRCNWSQDEQRFNVVIVNLEENNLTGSLPDTIGDLDYADFIHFENNNLSGNIPPSIGNLHALILNLSNNKLEGSIPDSIWGISNLDTLKLNENNLTGTISSAISQATDLRELQLYGNQLVGKIPSEITQLKRLDTLYLAENRSLFADQETAAYINRIPDNDGNIFGVAYDNILYYNTLKGAGALYRLYTDTNGEHWKENENWLIGDPCLDHWQHIYCDDTNSQVTKIYLHDNNLSGTIPVSISDLSYLKELRLNGNNLVGHIPRSIFSFDNLTDLLLNQNLLTGEIPEKITQLPNGIFLLLNENYYLYSNSDTVKNFINTEAEHSYADINATNKVFDSELSTRNYFSLLAFYDETNGAYWRDKTHWDYADPCKYNWHGIMCDTSSHITSINLSDNNLSGNIPDYLGEWVKLRYLDLSDNNLNGEIPQSIGNLIYLDQLRLHNNRLTGSIPSNLPDTLRILLLHGNQLSGNIPREIGEMFDLEWLYLSYNNLYGDIPEELTNLENLTQLYLHHNCALSVKESKKNLIKTFIDDIAGSGAFDYTIDSNHQSCVRPANMIPVLMYLLD